MADFFGRDRKNRRRENITYFTMMLDAVKVIGVSFSAMGLFVMMPAVYDFNTKG
jgi:hypothetical protein